jgi:D-alanyl-D-alanine dipeptidase
MVGLPARLALIVTAVAAAPAKLPAGFVDLATVAPNVALDLLYAGSRNFVGRPVRGYGAARCLLTKQAAAALAEVQRDLAASGLGLLVYDCYRPQRAVDDFVAWARAPGGAATVPAYNPVVPRAELLDRGYIAARSGHSRGSAVDVTLVPSGPRKRFTAEARDCRAIAGPLAPDGSLNMGTTFDCFDPRSHGDDAQASPEARRNRLRLRQAMEKRGFVPYPQEWWHFTLAREPFPETAFDFEIRP